LKVCPSAEFLVFRSLNECKRIAMRADKTDQSFEAMIHLAAAAVNSRSISTDPGTTVAFFI
jgi:hypothetical protein